MRVPKVKRKQLLFSGVIFCALVLGVTLVRYLYFHALLPNTFGSKPTTGLSIAFNLYKTLVAQNSNIPFPTSAILIFVSPLLITGCRRALRINYNLAAMLISSTLAGLIFSLYALPDWTWQGRYFAPYLPATLVLLWLGLLDMLWRSFPHSHYRAWRPLIATVCVLTFVIAGVVHTIMKLQPEAMRQYPGYVLSGTTLVEPSLWIRDHLPDDAVIATRRIGALAYYSNKRVFDYKFGLTEPGVSQLIKQRQQNFESPNDPDLASLWRTVQPGYILEDDHILAQIAADSGGTLEGFTIHGITYRTIQRFTIGDNRHWVLAARNSQN